MLLATVWPHQREASQLYKLSSSLLQLNYILENIHLVIFKHSIEKLLSNRRLPTTYPCIPFIPNYSKGTDRRSIAPHWEKGAKFETSTILTKLLDEHHETLQQKWKLFQRNRWKLVVNKRIAIVSPSSLQSEHKSEKSLPGLCSNLVFLYYPP